MATRSSWRGYTLPVIRGYPDSILQFLEAGIDRHDVLITLLEDLAARSGLHLGSVSLAGSRHIILAPGHQAGNTGGRRCVCIAHYDRHGDSPGANDNSAAVFQLAEAARQLGNAKMGGWTIVFTDREEAAGCEGAHGQGACGLAKALESILPDTTDVFIFDACGRGDTLILSTTIDRLLADERVPALDKTRSRLHQLRRRALDAAAGIAGQERFLAPTPFSDDAGFLAAGVLAQTITLLPSDEAQHLLAGAGRKRELRTALIARDEGDHTSAVPHTWKLFHSPQDNLESLTSSSFARMVRFQVALCGPYRH